MPLKKSAKTVERSPTTVVLYLRVSTTDQAENDLSIPAQRRSLEAYCRERSYVVADVYVEPGASARDDQRPVFRKMMTDVLAATSPVSMIVVYHSSRFMRNAYKAQLHKNNLKKHGVRVVSSQHNASDDPQGRLAEQIFEAMDEYESEVNGVRTSAAMAENARQGFFNGSTPPFGFSIERVEVRAGSFKNKLVRNPVEADVAREVFRLYVGGLGAKATARALNQRGVGYRGGLWSSDLVLKVVQEEAAVGTYYWGRRDHGVARDKGEWIPSPAPAIIDDELFALARRVREERDPERNPGRASSSPLLLARLLRCGRCGASCALETSGKVGPTGGEHPYRYYNCRTFLRVGKEGCRGCRVPLAQLDEAVLEHVAESVFSAESCDTRLRAFVEESGNFRTKTAGHRKELEDQIADFERRIARWQEAFESGAEAFEVAGPRLRELRAKRDELVATLAKVVPIRQVPPHLYTDATIRRFRESLHDMLSNRSTLTKSYLGALVESITVSPGKAGLAIDIAARTDAAVAMIAEGGGKGGLKHPEQVLTTVTHWRPRHEPNVRPTV
jgi:DNA invertase Pin-like site-specific DNA recombinase